MEHQKILPMREPSSKVLNSRWSRLRWWWWRPSVVTLSLSGPLSSVLSTFLIVGSSSYSAHSLITIQSAGYSLHLTQHNLISGYIVATTTSRFPCRVLRVLWWNTTNENPKTYKMSSWAINWTTTRIVPILKSWRPQPDHQAAAAQTMQREGIWSPTDAHRTLNLGTGKNHPSTMMMMRMITMMMMMPIMPLPFAA